MRKTAAVFGFLSLLFTTAAFAPVPVWAQATTLNATCIGIEAPETVTPGQSFTTRVTLRNSGTSMWLRSQDLLLSENRTFGNLWSYLSRSVHPGQTHTFAFNTRAPTTPGVYSLSLRMTRYKSTIEEFGQVCSKSITVRSSDASSVTLSSVSIQGQNVTVTYGKNFDTCAHFLSEHGQILHTQNVFCQSGNRISVTQPLTQVRVTTGQKVKLCHGNNGSTCSNLVTVTGQTSLADLSITKSTPASAVIGDTINYAITVMNSGGAIAQNVVVTDMFPRGLQHVGTAFAWSPTVNNSSSNVSCTVSNGLLTCTVINFAAGGSLTFNIAMKVATPSNQPSSTPYCPSTISNTANVRTSSSESNLANNVSSPVSTRINCPPMSVSVSIDGPASRIITLDENNVVFANVVLTAMNGKVDVKKLPVLFEVLGPATDQDVHQMMEDFELRNVVTGQVIKGSAVSGGAGGNLIYGTFLFENFIVEGTGRYELRADMIDNGHFAHPFAGDRIRAKICAESVAGSNNCNFEGVPVSNDQKIDARDLATNQPVTILPGGIIAGNMFTVGLPTLNITVKAIGSADTATTNQKDINLLRFEARAGEAEGIVLNGVTFNAQMGSLFNAQNYTLWVDTDQNGAVDTVLQRSIHNIVNNLVDFLNLTGGGYDVPKGATVVFEVHADVASSLTSNQLQLKFATATAHYIVAEELDDGSTMSGISTNGACNETAPFCSIFVSTTDSKIWNFVNQ